MPQAVDDHKWALTEDENGLRAHADKSLAANEAHATAPSFGIEGSWFDEGWFVSLWAPDNAVGVGALFLTGSAEQVVALAEALRAVQRPDAVPVTIKANKLQVGINGTDGTIITPEVTFYPIQQYVPGVVHLEFSWPGFTEAVPWPFSPEGLGSMTDLLATFAERCAEIEAGEREHLLDRDEPPMA